MSKKFVNSPRLLIVAARRIFLRDPLGLPLAQQTCPRESSRTAPPAKPTPQTATTSPKRFTLAHRSGRAAGAVRPEHDRHAGESDTCVRGRLLQRQLRLLRNGQLRASKEVAKPERHDLARYAALARFKRTAKASTSAMSAWRMCPEYRLRVDDQISFLFRLTREETDKPYLINVGDEFQVESFTDANLNRNLLVQPDGTVTLRLLGQVKATKLTVAKLRDKIEELYKQVSTKFPRSRSRRSRSTLGSKTCAAWSITATVSSAAKPCSSGSIPKEPSRCPPSARSWRRGCRSKNSSARSICNTARRSRASK